MNHNTNTRYTSDAMSDINRGIYSRNIPSDIMYTDISQRPSPTKYVLLSDIVTRNVDQPNSRETSGEYSVSSVFNPGNRMAPWNGFSQNIDTESNMRNQFMALSRNDRSQWMPSSRSDMYREYNPPSIEKEIQPFPRLFAQPIFSHVNRDVYNIETTVWDNNTRQKIKEKVKV